MDCSQASRGDAIGLIARPSFKSAIFSGVPLRTLFLRVKSARIWEYRQANISLVIGGWPRLRRKIRRCCLADGASQAPPEQKINRRTRDEKDHDLHGGDVGLGV